MMGEPSSLHNIIKLNYSKKAFFSTLADIIKTSQNKAQIILEGPQDVVILEQFIDIHIRKLPCDGRGNVVKIFKHLPTKYSNICGIADKDYDSSPYSDFRLFYYDGNCLEMMVFKDNDIFKNASLFNDGIHVYTESSLISDRDYILNKLFPISIFRLINNNLSKHIKLETVYSNLNQVFVDTKESTIQQIRSGILINLTDLSTEERNSIINKYDSALLMAPLDFYNITRGHDFVELFLNKTGFSLSEEDFYNDLKKAFSASLFKKTNLYKHIKDFEFNQMISVLSI